MNKRFLLWVLVLTVMEIRVMEQNSYEVKEIKFRISNRTATDIYLIEIYKHWVDQQKNSTDYYADVLLYKTERFNLFGAVSQTCNMWPDSVGILDVKYAESSDSCPLLSGVYYWDARRENVYLHLYKKYYDFKYIQINPKLLASLHTITLNLQGKGLSDSYFSYSCMSDDQ